TGARPNGAASPFHRKPAKRAGGGAGFRINAAVCMIMLPRSPRCGCSPHLSWMNRADAPAIPSPERIGDTMGQPERDASPRRPTRTHHRSIPKHHGRPLPDVGFFVRVTLDKATKRGGSLGEEFCPDHL